MRDQLGDFDVATRALLIALADRAASTWREPDAGMWEARDARRHYTSSKVMCWVALDRAVAPGPAARRGRRHRALDPRARCHPRHRRRGGLE
ncbi:MAG: glycoside hydrolase family 15 protein [Actinomycetota bacterium]|nr:glycoside hydrolase family 15 protein [Actinomycetota bacterium]